MCGWCTKWDKKCDIRIPKKYRDPIVISGKETPKRGLRAKANVIDETSRPCSECDNEGWDMPECKGCNTANDFKYFERKKDTK